MSSSFSRAVGASKVLLAGTRPGLHGQTLVSTGIADLDNILGGGITLGSILLVLEDAFSPHHLTLLRCFLAQGLSHGHSLFLAAPIPDSRSLLGTLPALVAPSQPSSHGQSSGGPEASKQGDDGLRIAWQYRRFIDEQKALEGRRLRQAGGALSVGSRHSAFVPGSASTAEYCGTFDLRRPIERRALTEASAECASTLGDEALAETLERCSAFVRKHGPQGAGVQGAVRIGVLSVCAPQCAHASPSHEWEVLAFLQSLKGLLRSSPHAAALVTLPVSVVSDSLSMRAQHIADGVLKMEAISEDGGELAASLADYADMIGFLRVVKLPSIGTLVPMVPETSVYGMKLQKRRHLTLSPLSPGAVDATGGLGDASSSSAASLLCAGPQGSQSVLDF